MKKLLIWTLLLLVMAIPIASATLLDGMTVAVQMNGSSTDHISGRDGTDNAIVYM